MGTTATRGAPSATCHPCRSRSAASPRRAAATISRLTAFSIGVRAALRGSSHRAARSRGARTAASRGAGGRYVLTTSPSRGCPSYTDPSRPLPPRPSATPTGCTTMAACASTRSPQRCSASVTTCTAPAPAPCASSTATARSTGPSRGARALAGSRAALSTCPRAASQSRACAPAAGGFGPWRSTT